MTRSESSGAPPRARSVSVEALAGLLDLLDRPALLIDEAGKLLARNAAAAGLGEPADDVRDRLPEADPQRWAAHLAEQAGSAPTAGADDPGRRIRLEVFERQDGGRVALAVLARDPAGSPQEDSAVALRHDLAGPVTAILGTAELLLLRGLDLPREVRDCLGQILDNCGRISEILAQSAPVSRADGQH